MFLYWQRVSILCELHGVIKDAVLFTIECYNIMMSLHGLKTDE